MTENAPDREGGDAQSLEDVAFPPIGADEPEPATAAGDGGDGGDSVEDRIAALQAEFAEREARYQRMIDRLVTGVAAATSATKHPDLPARAEPDEIEALPDPIARPKEFAKALNRMVASAIRQTSQESLSAQENERRIEAARARFWELNKDLSEYQEFVAYAYQQEADALRAQGIDPQRALLSDTDGMIKRVADRARERMAQLGIRTGDADTAPSRHVPPRRTGGVSAGSRPPARTGKQDDAKASTFLAELRELQAATGFH